jgi:hypothetical protein
MRYMVSNELYHHGVKGQKWGVRRFQNEDGSLTSEGKRRIDKTNAKKLRRQLERDIRRKRGEQYGSSNRWMTGRGIGKNSNNALADQQKKMDEILSSKASKDFDRKVAKIDRDLNDEKIDLDEYNERWEQARREWVKETDADRYFPVMTSTSKGMRFVDDYVNHSGKQITVGYLKDLGYDQAGSEYIEAKLRKEGLALY